MIVKLRSEGGSHRLTFESQLGTGSIWISELPNTGVLLLRVEGRGSIEIEDQTTREE